MSYVNASDMANQVDLQQYQQVDADSSVVWLEKAHSGKVSLEDIKDALKEFANLFNAGMASKAEVLTLARAFPNSQSYTTAALDLEDDDGKAPIVIGGPASIEMVDREGHLITTQALDKAFKKFMKSSRTRNVMVLHSDVQVGWALPAYISKGGQIFKSGVDNKGLFFICELRDDTAISKKVAEQIHDGQLKSYSIAGSALKVQNMTKGLTPYMQVDEMELAEVTVCEKGVNQGASFELLKAEMPQTGKVDKDQCGYRDSTAPENALGINCGHCKYFNAEDRTCDVVVGDIMPGDYCRLFEPVETKPHRKKVIIMNSEKPTKIDFNKTFSAWMAKEADPLKSGKSFATLENEAGRRAEHEQLLREYGFPSGQPEESMRYVPVVEVETDEDGKIIHNLPPWVVNEAGEALGDRLDDDAPSSAKSKAQIKVSGDKADKKAVQKMGYLFLADAPEGATYDLPNIIKHRSNQPHNHLGNRDILDRDLRTIRRGRRIANKRRGRDTRRQQRTGEFRENPEQTRTASEDGSRRVGESVPEDVLSGDRLRGTVAEERQATGRSLVDTLRNVGDVKGQNLDSQPQGPSSGWTPSQEEGVPEDVLSGSRLRRNVGQLKRKQKKQQRKAFHRLQRRGTENIDQRDPDDFEGGSQEWHPTIEQRRAYKRKTNEERDIARRADEETARKARIERWKQGGKGAFEGGRENRANARRQIGDLFRGAKEGYQGYDRSKRTFDRPWDDSYDKTEIVSPKFGGLYRPVSGSEKIGRLFGQTGRRGVEVGRRAYDRRKARQYEERGGAMGEFARYQEEARRRKEEADFRNRGNVGTPSKEKVEHGPADPEPYKRNIPEAEAKRLQDLNIGHRGGPPGSESLLQFDNPHWQKHKGDHTDLREEHIAHHTALENQQNLGGGATRHKTLLDHIRHHDNVHNIDANGTRLNNWSIDHLGGAKLDNKMTNQEYINWHQQGLSQGRIRNVSTQAGQGLDLDTHFMNTNNAYSQEMKPNSLKIQAPTPPPEGGTQIPLPIQQPDRQVLMSLDKSVDTFRSILQRAVRSNYEYI